jgi:hypothetical protein
MTNLNLDTARMLSNAGKWHFIAIAYAKQPAARTEAQIYVTRAGLCAAAILVALPTFDGLWRRKPETVHEDCQGYWWPIQGQPGWTRSCDMARAKFAMQQWQRLNHSRLVPFPHMLDQCHEYHGREYKWIWDRHSKWVSDGTKYVEQELISTYGTRSLDT